MVGTDRPAKPIHEEKSFVDLSNQDFSVLPTSSIVHIKDRAIKLALFGNKLTCLLNEFSLLTRLENLSLRSNRFTEFPKVLCDLPKLDTLDISCNEISTLPNEFGNLLNLKVFSISRNKLQSLPSYIASMDKLEMLKVFKNPLPEYPPEIFQKRATTHSEMQASIEAIKNYLQPKKIESQKVLRSISNPVNRFMISKNDTDSRPRSRSDAYNNTNMMIPKRFNDHTKKLDVQTVDNICAIEISRSYFRKISTLKIKYDSVNVTDALHFSRMTLYVSTQLQQCVKQYTECCYDIAATKSLEKVLESVERQIVDLVSFSDLEEAKKKPNPSILYKASENCIKTCTQAVTHLSLIFKIMFYKADIRHSRAFLVVLFDIYKELLNNWSKVKSILANKDINYSIKPCKLEVTQNSNANSNVYIRTFSAITSPSRKASTRTGNNSRLNANVDYNIKAATNALTKALTTEDLGGLDKQLVEKIYETTSNAIYSLNALYDTIILVAQSRSKVNETNDSNFVSKVKESALMFLKAIEVTRILQAQLKFWEFNKSSSTELYKLHEYIQTFIRSVIIVANTTKVISKEVTFPRNILNSMSTLTRTTKELTILFSMNPLWENFAGSEVGSNLLVKRSNSVKNQSNAASVTISTPLSAAVGLTALQSTLLSPRINVEYATPKHTRSLNMSPYSADNRDQSKL